MGVCCEIEHIDADMSSFLTQSQKENYYGQYKIKCCDSVTNVKKHILEYMSESPVSDFSEEKFFFDDKGNLYAIIGTFGFEGGDEIEIQEYSNSKIVAIKTSYDEYGDAVSQKTFTMVKTQNGFIIESIKRKSLI